MNLAEIKRNGYPCDSRTFWSLVETVEQLAKVSAEIDTEIDTLREVDERIGLTPYADGRLCELVWVQTALNPEANQ
jgi:hypothetical protein